MIQKGLKTFKKRYNECVTFVWTGLVGEWKRTTDGRQSMLRDSYLKRTYMLECCGKFKPKEILFLKDTKDFFKRRLLYGQCPVCKNWVACLYETRFSDRIIFIDIAKKRKAEAMYNRCKKELNYKYSGGTKHGTIFKSNFNYGDNREIKNCKGNVIAIRQRAVNFNGESTLIKEIVL